MKSQGICREMYGDTEYCITKEKHDVDCLLDLLSHIIDNREEIHQIQKLKLDEIKSKAYKAGKI